MGCCDLLCSMPPCLGFARVGCVRSATGRRIVCMVGIALVVFCQLCGIVACLSISTSGTIVKNIPFAYASSKDWGSLAPGANLDDGSVKIYYGLNVAVFSVAADVDLSAVSADQIPPGVEAGKDSVFSWSDIKDEPLICGDGDTDDACNECASMSSSLVILVVLVTIFNVFSLFPFLKRMRAEKDSVCQKFMVLFIILGVVINMAQLGGFDHKCFSEWINANGRDNWHAHLSVGWWLIVWMCVLDVCKLVLHAIIPVPDANISAPKVHATGTSMATKGAPIKQDV